MSNARTRFDVSRPGSTPASHTSRPTITSYDHIDSDPMIQVTQNPAASLGAPKKRQAINIAPPNQPAELAPASTESPTDQPLAADNIESKPDTDSLESKPGIESDNIDDSAIQALITSKTYNLPISTAPSGQVLRLVIAVAVMIVALGLVVAVLFL